MGIIKKLSNITDAPYSEASGTILRSETNDYAIYGGTSNYYYSGSTPSPPVAYSKTLTKSTLSQLLKDISQYPAAGRVGKYAIFAGGQYKTSSSGSNYYRTSITAYNNYLTRVNAGSLSTGDSFWGYESANNDNYLIFPSTKRAGAGIAIDSSLTIHTISAFPTTLLTGAIATYFYNYAVFIYDKTSSQVCQTYNESLTAGSFTTPASINGYGGLNGNLSYVRDHLVYAGGTGSTSSSFSQTIITYDKSLTASKLTSVSLSVARKSMEKTSVNGYACFFIGGSGASNSNAGIVVDVIDEYLTRQTPTQLDTSISRRSGYGATNVGDYVLIGAGDNGTSNGLEVYKYITPYYGQITKIYIGVDGLARQIVT